MSGIEAWDWRSRGELQRRQARQEALQRYVEAQEDVVAVTAARRAMNSTKLAGVMMKGLAENSQEAARITAQDPGLTEACRLIEEQLIRGSICILARYQGRPL